jgi:regulatory protein
VKTAASVGNPLESTKVDLKENPEADPFSVARNIALRQLSMAPKSRLQLEESLAKRKVSPEVAAAVLDRLTEVGLIDDLAYAGMLVRSRCLTKKVSKSVLKMELRKKGISDEYIEVALSEISDADEYQMATDLVIKKLRSMKNLERDVMQRRLFSLLARKGYHAGIATKVIREQLNDPDFLADQALANLA